jgi:hypothetical protein
MGAAVRSLRDGFVQKTNAGHVRMCRRALDFAAFARVCHTGRAPLSRGEKRQNA